MVVRQTCLGKFGDIKHICVNVHHMLITYIANHIAWMCRWSIAQTFQMSRQVNNYCHPNWLTCGMRAYQLYTLPLHPIFLKHEVFKAEISRWRVRWSMIDRKPSRLQDTLEQQTCKDMYPCIFTIIGVFKFLPCHRRPQHVKGRLVA